MELKEYIEKGGQKLRLGYTTGSCAAAAAKAAALMLLTGEKVPQVRLREQSCIWRSKRSAFQRVLFPARCGRTAGMTRM